MRHQCKFDQDVLYFVRLFSQYLSNKSRPESDFQCHHSLKIKPSIFVLNTSKIPLCSVLRRISPARYARLSITLLVRQKPKSQSYNNYYKDNRNKGGQGEAKLLLCVYLILLPQCLYYTFYSEEPHCAIALFLLCRWSIKSLSSLQR